MTTKFRKQGFRKVAVHCIGVRVVGPRGASTLGCLKSELSSGQALKPTGRASPLYLTHEEWYRRRQTSPGPCPTSCARPDLSSLPFAKVHVPTALLPRFARTRAVGVDTDMPGASQPYARWRWPPLASRRGSRPAHTDETTARRGCKGSAGAAAAAAQPARPPFCRPARFTLPAGRPFPSPFPLAIMP